jgi:hypothetical protein
MKKVVVLFFAADPLSSPVGDGRVRLRLDEEVREIRAKVRAAEHRDALEFDFRLAATADDLIQALNENPPQVVHFSGHGGKAGLVLAGSDGQPHRVGTEALARLFGAFRGGIRVVVLNACLSLPQAEAIAAAVGCAVGTREAISDRAAMAFGASFYRAVAFGHSVRAAFDQACAAVAMSDPDYADSPVLVATPDVDPARLVLVPADRGTGERDVAPDAGRDVFTVSAPAARHGVPTCISPNAVKLFGRGAEVERFVGLLTSAPAEARAVRGLPGVGKTDFLRAVGCAPAVVEHFRGGVLYAELGQAADAVDILRRWCAGLGIEPPKSETAADLAETIRGRLAGRPALLILDDVWETTVAAAQALSDCRAPGCALLLSSRSPDIAADFSGSPDRSERLGELDDVPAVELLREHAPHAVAADEEGAAELAGSLGKLPLALKLAGRLAERDDSPRPCGRLVGEWRMRLKEMSGYERRPGIASTDLSLHAIISLSYDAMPDDATRAAAASLSVLAAPALGRSAPLDFDRTAIEVAWTLALRWIPADSPRAKTAAPALMEEWITSFVGSGLLERNPATRRYSLHQTVHAFLEERCRAIKMPSA